MPTTPFVELHKALKTLHFIVDDEALRKRYTAILSHIVDGTSSLTEWGELPRGLVYGLPFELFLKLPEHLWDQHLSKDIQQMFADVKAGHDIPMYPDSDSDDDWDSEEEYDAGEPNRIMNTPIMTPTNPELLPDEPEYTQTDTGTFGGLSFSEDNGYLDEGEELAASSSESCYARHSDHASNDVHEVSSQDSRVSSSSDEAQFLHHPDCACPRDHYCLCIYDWHAGAPASATLLLNKLDKLKWADSSHVQTFQAVKQIRGDGFGNHESSLKCEFFVSEQERRARDME